MGPDPLLLFFENWFLRSSTTGTHRGQSVVLTILFENVSLELSLGGRFPDSNLCDKTHRFDEPKYPINGNLL
jgi:hypothetical protein